MVKILFISLLLLLSIITVYTAELLNATSDFTGGLNATNDMRLKPNEAFEINNYKLTKWGDLISRNGILQHCYIEGSPEIINIFEYKKRGGWNRLIASAKLNNNIVLYEISPDTQNEYHIINFPDTLTYYEGYKNMFWQHQDILYYSDGKYGVYKYNGIDTQNVYKVGIEAPQNVISLDTTTSTGGGLAAFPNQATGYYYYRYRYITDTDNWNYVASNPNDTFIKVELEVDVDIETKAYTIYTANDTGEVITSDSYIIIEIYQKGSITITGFIPSTNPLATNIEIWRSEVQREDIIGSEPLYYYLDTIDINDTFYLDNKHDTELGASPLNVGKNHTPLLPLKFGDIYLGRFIGGGNDTEPYKIYISGDLRPDYYPENLQFSSEVYNSFRGDYYDFSAYGLPTSIQIINGNIIVTTKNTMWAIYINDVTDVRTWQAKQISKEVGSLNHFGNANQNEFSIMATNEGVYTLAMQMVGGTSVGSNPQFQNIGLKVEPIYNNYIKDNFQDIVGHYSDYTYRLAYKYNDYGYNNKELIWDTRWNGWTEYSGYYPTCYVYTKDNELFAGSPFGVIYQLEANNSEKEDYDLDGENFYESQVDTAILSGLYTNLYFSDTFPDNALIGFNAYSYNPFEAEWQGLPIVSNNDTIIVVLGNYDWDIGNYEVRIGYIFKQYKTGWQWADNFLSTKKLHQLWFDCEGIEGDVNLRIFANNEDIWYNLDIENIFSVDRLGTTFRVGISVLGSGTDFGARKKYFLTDYPVLEKYKLRFTNITEKSLTIKYFTVRYESLDIRDPLVE